LGGWVLFSHKFGIVRRDSNDKSATCYTQFKWYSPLPNENRGVIWHCNRFCCFTVGFDEKELSPVAETGGQTQKE